MIVGRDLLTDRPAESAAFYAALFGWTARDGRLWRGDEPLAGLVPLDPDIGWPAHWVPYVRVPDVTAALGRVLTQRGSVLMPPEAAPGGEWAVVADPDGTPLGLTTAGAMAELPMELWCEDDAVRGFYARVFGWTARVADMGALGAGWVLSEGFTPRMTLLRTPLDPPGCWVPWVEGDVELVSRLARVRLGPLTLEGVGRVVILEDPGGAVIGCLEA